jgi:hypothetical protein
LPRAQAARRSNQDGFGGNPFATALIELANGRRRFDSFHGDCRP